MFYPYKKNLEKGSNTVPDPYIKAKDVVDNHEYSLDYEQWLSVITTYIELIAEDLKQGLKFKMPNRLGYLQIVKFKTNKLINLCVTTKHKKIVYYNNLMTENHFFKLKWHRQGTTASMKFKWHWSLKSNALLLKDLYDRCDKNYTYISKIITDA